MLTHKPDENNGAQVVRSSRRSRLVHDARAMQLQRLDTAR
jgi:hypothetical protein